MTITEGVLNEVESQPTIESCNQVADIFGDLPLCGGWRNSLEAWRAIFNLIELDPVQASYRIHMYFINSTPFYCPHFLTVYNDGKAMRQGDIWFKRFLREWITYYLENIWDERRDILRNIFLNNKIFFWLIPSGFFFVKRTLKRDARSNKRYIEEAFHAIDFKFNVRHLLVDEMPDVFTLDSFAPMDADFPGRTEMLARLNEDLERLMYTQPELIILRKVYATYMYEKMRRSNTEDRHVPQDASLEDTFIPGAGGVFFVNNGDLEVNAVFLDVADVDESAVGDQDPSSIKASPDMPYRIIRNAHNFLRPPDDYKSHGLPVNILVPENATEVEIHGMILEACSTQYLENLRNNEPEIIPKGPIPAAATTFDIPQGIPSGEMFAAATMEEEVMSAEALAVSAKAAPTNVTGEAGIFLSIAEHVLPKLPAPVTSDTTNIPLLMTIALMLEAAIRLGSTEKVPAGEASTFDDSAFQQATPVSSSMSDDKPFAQEIFEFISRVHVDTKSNEWCTFVAFFYLVRLLFMNSKAAITASTYQLFWVTALLVAQKMHIKDPITGRSIRTTSFAGALSELGIDSAKLRTCEDPFVRYISKDIAIPEELLLQCYGYLQTAEKRALGTPTATDWNTRFAAERTR
jgi:hypothetical protein